MLSVELSEQPAPALAALSAQTAMIDPAIQPANAASGVSGETGIEVESEAGVISPAETNAIKVITAQTDPTHSISTQADSSNSNFSELDSIQSISVQSSTDNAIQSVPTVEQAIPVQARPVRAQRHWRPSTRRLIILACIVLGVRIFIGEASVVPTASMEGTILVGDHLFMDKLLYGPEIPVVGWRLPMLKHLHRGDIIVFRYPKDPSETFLKRVAAMGGDRVEIRDGILYVNSQPVQEPYAVHQAAIHNPLESWGPVVVPEGRLFVMGDNRDNSSDSRDWGYVPVGNVIGSPMFVYWSYDAPTSRWLDENFEHRMTFYASIAENFFSRTRWSRTGTLL